MKHFSLYDEIVSWSGPVSNNAILKVSGFHPDFFTMLINSSKRSLFINVSDESFDSVKKCLSSFWDDDSIIFIEPYLNKVTPEGFISDSKRQLLRSKSLLSSGVSGFSAIFCAESYYDHPIIGNKAERSFVLDKDTDYSDLIVFLKAEKYEHVDEVSSPGEFCQRGGLIDVFPKYTLGPYRICFFDSFVEIYRFNVNTQITFGKNIKQFKIKALNNNKTVSFAKHSLDGFLCAKYKNKTLTLLENGGNKKHIALESMVYSDFILNKNKFSSHIYSDQIISVGLVLEKNIIVPEWFSNKRISSAEPPKTVSPFILSKINKGDFLVHKKYGVGVCEGLGIRDSKNKQQEFLIIKYLDGGLVSVDVSSLNQVSFFASKNTEGVQLNSLSKQKQWERKWLAAKKQAERSIEGLLKTYVDRKNTVRDGYFSMGSLESEFLSAFPHQDTPDQKTAWKNIVKDLESSHPMDRLLCGDVGFGKTELAIRSAFRVVMSGKRVVVLAPTTILASQLYSSFLSRLEPFAVSVNIVSRFKSVADKNKVKREIFSKTNDILVGTHSILNDGMYFDNVGLFVIDEEHRFGVKQKEIIKKTFKSIDVLSMSATPIPRSINLSISNIYSISMLQTPPLLRRPISTKVEFFNFDSISSAVEFELDRGGQVYFIHNDISSIDSIVYKLSQLFTNRVVEFLHGQEASSNIEKKMSKFVAGAIDVLVCTSIIESGIDISSVNTVIINNCHLFGLSQLYQMRGRVGRGKIQAYAYLLIPKKHSLSEVAYRRIKTIEENTILGSGYSVALSDMEIRGGGTLFDYKQSGGSGSVGYEMYIQMVQDSLKEVFSKDIKKIKTKNIEIVFFNKRYIPEDYIGSESIRMSIYNSLSTSYSEVDIDDLVISLINRFGKIPSPLNNLIKEFKLKLIVNNINISSIIRKGCGVVCCFEGFDNQSSSTALFNYILSYWKNKKTVFHIIPTNKQKLSICLHLCENEDSFSKLSSFINKFTPIKSNNRLI